MVALPKRVQADFLPELMSEVGEAAERGSIHLDMRAVEAIEGHAGPVLASLLLSTLGQVRAEVHPPASSELLARTGIAFALANRSAATRVQGEDAAERWPAWGESWVPGNRATVDALFGPKEAGESADVPNLIGDRYAAFVNPHLSRPSGEQHEVVNLIHPWLRQLLPRKAVKGELLDDLGTIVTELVENVRQHASRTADAQPTNSVVHVWLTRGTGDRVYVSVLDDGPGLVTTARDKVIDGQLMHVDELLRGVLLGSVAKHNPARGLGLPDVSKLVDTHGAALWLSTADRFVSLEADELGIQAMPFEVGGTVVTLRFALGS